MKQLIPALVCLILVACEKEQPVKLEGGGFNSLIDTKVETIEKENQIYYELTLKQKINPQAPTYVTNLRESKWINKLSYGLQKQTHDEDFVISVFHIRPLVPMNSIVLKKDDFEWYPEIAGFAPIIIETQRANQPEQDNPTTRP